MKPVPPDQFIDWLRRWAEVQGVGIVSVSGPFLQPGAHVAHFAIVFEVATE